MSALRSFSAEMLNRIDEGLGFHDHARAAAKRAIVHGLMPIAGIVAELMDSNFDQTGPLGAAKDAFGHHRLGHRWKKG
jgi:hypothetical protein